MIRPKKLIQLVRKWQNMVAARRKRISLPTINKSSDAERCSNSPIASKGHFVVYSADHIRFVIPLKFLKNEIFRELFKMSEEEFGLPRNGPIILPCDAQFVKYVISLVKGCVAKDVERTLLMSIATGHCLSFSNLHQKQIEQRLLICSC